MHYRRAKAPGAADFFTVVTYNRQPARVVGSKQVGWWAGVHPSYAMSNNAYPRMMARAVNLGVLTAH
jgi:hypothetical protein